MVHCNYPNPYNGIKLAYQMVYEAPVDKKNESSMVGKKLQEELSVTYSRKVAVHCVRYSNQIIEPG
jgi:hypothetical protein